MKNNKALKLHAKLKGKITTTSKINLRVKNNLSLAYTPGVGAVVEYIKRNKKGVYRLTGKNNAVAVVTDGSAVLGLGNVGPAAALPVMEGKCAIFKEFAGIDAYPICLATQDVDEIVQTIQNISPGFGGINLEDISAPRCFEIEKKLQEVLDIPVMHDDQHATAIIVLAGIFNALKVANKILEQCTIVVVGCGAAGTAIIKLLSNLPTGDIIALDREGILSSRRKNLSDYKRKLVSLTNKGNLTGGLKEAIRNADILIGVSTRGLFTESIIRLMAENPIVFALANPDPEVMPANAKKWGVKIIATGRSDYPNQINNALVFPGFFKGLLKNKIMCITPKMKIKTAKALASLVKNPSEDYFIPSIFDRRVVPAIVRSFK
jgi:malate dehydrogenase (oxaloacetate-decarboxylating)